jgi:hypothetical protein
VNSAAGRPGLRAVTTAACHLQDRLLVLTLLCPRYY